MRLRFMNWLQEKKLVDSVLNDLSNLKNIIRDNKELSLVVKSPLISSSDKQNIFETLIKKNIFVFD